MSSSNKPTHEISIHLRRLVNPVENQIGASKRAFKVHGIDIVVESNRKVNKELLQVVEVDSDTTQTTEEQDELFSLAPDGDTSSITAFVVEETVPPYWGVSNRDKRCVIVSKHAKAWTLAHEIGHVLGLDHFSGMGSVSRLMVEGGPVNGLVRSIPVFAWPELVTMSESSLLKPITETS